MILFPHIRTRRIAVRLRELTLGEAIAVCKLPAERHELTTTEFLRFVASAAEAPQPQYLTDPRLWSVEERTLLVCHYLAQVSDDGPDFAVGGSAKLTDYVVFDADLAIDRLDLQVAGKAMAMRPLNGLQAETLERACTDRGEWLIGAMACQVLPADEAEPAWADMSDVQALEWVKARSEAIRALPESDFEALLLAYSDGARRLHHFFAISFDDQGVVCEPNEQEAGHRNPARFRAASCLSDAALRLFGRSDNAGR